MRFTAMTLRPYLRSILYEEDQKTLDDAKAKGLLIMAEAFNCPDACWDCKTRSKSLQTWEDDDIGQFVCYNEKCKYRKGRR